MRGSCGFPSFLSWIDRFILRQAEPFVELRARGLVLLNHLLRVLRHLFGARAWHDNHAVAVGHNHVTGFNQRSAAYNGAVDRFDLVAARPYAAPHLAEVERDFLGDDLVSVARGVAGYQANHPALFPRQDIVRADRADVLISRLLDDQRRAFAQQRDERLAGNPRVPLPLPLVEVLRRHLASGWKLRRHVARGDGDAHEAVREVRRVFPQWPDVGTQKPGRMQPGLVHTVRNVGYAQSVEERQYLLVVIERVDFGCDEALAAPQLGRLIGGSCGRLARNVV